MHDETEHRIHTRRKSRFRIVIPARGGVAQFIAPLPTSASPGRKDAEQPRAELASRFPFRRRE
jgi:hypothetical protein